MVKKYKCRFCEKEITRGKLCRDCYTHKNRKRKTSTYSYNPTI